MYQVMTPENFHVQKKGFEKKIIYLDETIASKDDRARISRSLNMKNWRRLSMDLPAFSSEEKLFIKALQLFLSEQYEGAFQMFDQLEDSSYSCQVQLLKIDCLYHMQEGKEVDIDDFKARYQEVYDCAHSEKIKSIVITRFRFLRYAS